jgi:hypothetical protein
MKVIFLLAILGAIVLSGCKSNHTSSIEISLKEHKILINGMPLDYVMSRWKAKRIERIVLAKIKQMSTEEKSDFGTKINPKVGVLLCESCCALGEDTLKYLNSLKVDDIILKAEIGGLIKDRLEIISLLRGYIPQNDLERITINRIMEYPASGTEFRRDNEDSYKTAPPRLQKLKIGPLRNGQYVYIQCYGYKSLWKNGVDEISGFQVCTGIKTSKVFFYNIETIYFLDTKQVNGPAGGIQPVPNSEK